ncbi:T-cell surface glycoprotein CD4-like [Brienomyrus brachyistius]|uniref:T-cell surface glycoprotein CD4-like n=1 Tax=Brienomyrus brachyistius TaxID=42636 RepID=UPI0020B26E75|nr:T-cell surface glycoprotein CD4-like [Brienomyrus brachyistius]XP_048882793.1 T-cell surface glycoprotein CD4-like [Brienomyrus brachyistius]XP_048882794.1 T-cell surface glycoprotein CD4-like [Brienomyrus brachyistius]
MKCLPRELVILVAIITMGWSQLEEVVVIGQVGHQVVLPRADALSRGSDVSWTFGRSKDSITQPVIIRQRGTPLYGEGMKGRVSLATSNISLIINSMNSNDVGYYKCDTSQSKTLYRLYSAKVTSQPASLVVASQVLSLDCEVDGLNQGLEFQWRCPQKSVKGTEKRLTMKHVTLRDHGEWICVVTHKGQRSDVKSPNEFFIKFSITVVDLIPSTPLYTTNGSSLVIPCYISANLELPALSSLQPIRGSWTFKPHVGNRGFQKVTSLTDKYQWEVVTNRSNWIRNTGPLKNHLSLDIASVLEADVGTYRCELIFKDQITISMEVKVNMLRVHSSPDSPIYYMGDAFNISCSLVGTEMSSDLRMKWTVPDKSSIKDTLDEPPPAVLSVRQATEKDKGRWKCELMKDGKALVSAELNLKIESRPVNVLLWLSICGAGILCILIIMAILKLRQRVHCRRRPKKKYCRCKNPQVKGFYKT